MKYSGNPLEWSLLECWTHYNLGVLWVLKFGGGGGGGVTILRPVRIYWYADLHAHC